MKNNHYYYTSYQRQVLHLSKRSKSNPWFTRWSTQLRWIMCNGSSKAEAKKNLIIGKHSSDYYSCKTIEQIERKRNIIYINNITKK